MRFPLPSFPAGRLVAGLVFLSPFLRAATPPPATAEVVIYGGTSAGITAALQTARLGRTALLIEPTQHLGGLTTGGLGATDIGNKRAIGGMAREFYGRIWEYYQQPSAWTRQARTDYVNRRGTANDPAERTLWTFEPHVATRVYDAMLREAGDRVTVVRGERLELAPGRGVFKEGARITRIVMESGRAFTGKMFIDATYEGDLMARAGVSYHVGREANATYGETINGVQAGHAFSHQFIRPVDPYVVPGDTRNGLLPGINPEGPGTEFAGNRKVQAYNFRLCTTDVPENRRAWENPPATTRAGTSSSCATSRPATTACRGTRSGCPTARPTPTTTSRSAPTSSARTGTTRKPTTPPAKKSGRRTRTGSAA